MKCPDIAATDLAWLSRLARALVQEPHAADDLVQDTVLAAAAAPQPLHHPRAFLATVARRLSARRARTEARRTRRERLAARDEQITDSTELVDRAEVAERVVRAARTLEEPFRTTVLAHYLDGAPVTEIARREGRSVDTIRWRLRQGIERLRTKLVSEDCRPWSEWSVLLLPLARAHEGAAVGLTAAAATGGPAATTLFVFMKTQGSIALAAVLLAVVCVALWFVPPTTQTPSTPEAATNRPARASAPEGPATAPDRAAPLAAQTPPRQAVRTQSAAAVQAANPDARWSVLVVDSSRRPIADARVRLVEIRPKSDQASRPRVRWHGTQRSDADGQVHFKKPQNAERFGLVANADGWLRTAMPPPLGLLDEPADPIVVVLEPGSQLRGRVVDPRGRPVPGLALLALTAGYGVNHVSLSSTALRAQNRFRDPRNADYQQSRAKTAADGSIAFDGVPALAELEVRSDDPAWRIVDAEKVTGDAPFVTWTAAPAIGVAVRVLDAARRPVPASGTFRVDLDLADGTRKDIGQWVGKGSGTLRFSFHEELFPPLGELDVVRATFHGTVTTRAGTESWRANPIPNPQTGGMTELEVLVAASESTAEDIPSSTPILTLVLDVRGGDGEPYSEPLLVGWTSNTSAGQPQGDVRAQQMRPGAYRAEVPVPGDIENLEILVQPRNASGSLPAWTKTIPATPDRQQVLSVRLPSAGTVVILRPAGWSTAWSVRASYRENPKEPWQGSWNYGTRDDRLSLTAMRPAQWRFELVQDSPARSRTLEVTIGAGDQLMVGG